MSGKRLGMNCRTVAGKVDKDGLLGRTHLPAPFTDIKFEPLAIDHPGSRVLLAFLYGIQGGFEIIPITDKLVDEIIVDRARQVRLSLALLFSADLDSVVLLAIEPDQRVRLGRKDFRFALKRLTDRARLLFKIYLDPEIIIVHTQRFLRYQVVDDTLPLGGLEGIENGLTDQGQSIMNQVHLDLRAEGKVSRKVQLELQRLLAALRGCDIFRTDELHVRLVFNILVRIILAESPGAEDTRKQDSGKRRKEQSIELHQSTSSWRRIFGLGR